MEKSVKFSAKKAHTGCCGRFSKPLILLDNEKIKNVLHNSSVYETPVSSRVHVCNSESFLFAHVSAHAKNTKSRVRVNSLIYNYIYNILLITHKHTGIFLKRIQNRERGKRGEKVAYMGKKGVFRVRAVYA